jgi:hypothetical protein
VSCHHPAVTNGTPCPDGLFCNGNESCQGGICQAGTNPCPALCDEGTDQCAATACQPAPQTCWAALKSILVAKNNVGDDGKDKLVWKWVRGEAISQTEFGDPMDTAAYALCVYADGALVGEAVVPASASQWSALSTKGYKYSDAAATAGGITTWSPAATTPSPACCRARPACRPNTPTSAPCRAPTPAG